MLLLYVIIRVGISGNRNYVGRERTCIFTIPILKGWEDSDAKDYHWNVKRSTNQDSDSQVYV